MPEFFNVLPPDEARALLWQHLTHRMEAERVPTAHALNRVTAKAIFAPHPLPSFHRSTMDGYAVRAADTFGASQSLPAFLQVTGEVAMGVRPTLTITTGEAAIVHTGGMLPMGADAVVQVELTQQTGDASGFPHEIEVLKAIGVGQNVLQIGEDVEEGEALFPAGHRLRPQDLGGLLGLGITDVAVARAPRVALLSTGDELVPPDQTLEAGQIRDINSYTIAAQTRQAGGVPIFGGIIPDVPEQLRAAAVALFAECDMLVITAGSSVSRHDRTVEVIASLGEPGVLLHGVATRPGKPTIIAVADGRPLLGLPGNPASAMIQFSLLGAPAVWRLQGATEAPLTGAVWATLAHNIASETGREDYVPARIEPAPPGERERHIAVPLFGKSNLIYTLVGADGLIKVPLNRGGLAAGEMVEVRLF
ncbi:MAG: molybdopterin molybdotransferase MoeA [Candidatus Promineifilaceae bacterium]|nr:molybdopterin molybdotransferase MoeA [Candidatus Promineifilaceae bacterium]